MDIVRKFVNLRDRMKDLLATGDVLLNKTSLKTPIIVILHVDDVQKVVFYWLKYPNRKAECDLYPSRPGAMDGRLFAVWCPPKSGWQRL